MYLRLLQIREPADVARYVALVAHAERLRGRLEAHPGRAVNGSNMAPEIVLRASEAAVRACPTPDGAETDAAAARGYGDIIRLVIDHPGEIPFTESQIKYFHSLLLRHDPATAAHRRQYRADEAVAREMPRLVAWARETIESKELHPLLAIGVFLGRFLALRPFAVGNGRLALALGGYLLDLYGYGAVRAAPIEEVVAERRDEVGIAIEAAGGDREDATAWVHAFVEIVAEAEQRVLDGAGTGEAARLSPRLGRLLDLMRERRAAKIGDLLPVLETPRATLKKDLRALVDAGHLTTEGVRKGTVYFVRE